jgi:hypothetical protein
MSGAGSGNSRAALDRKIKALEGVAGQCKQAGIGLAYHNHDVEFAGESREIDQMLRRTDAAVEPARRGMKKIFGV